MDWPGDWYQVVPWAVRPRVWETSPEKGPSGNEGAVASPRIPWPPQRKAGRDGIIPLKSLHFIDSESEAHDICDVLGVVQESVLRA